jgi:hypothetical protein
MVTDADYEKAKREYHQLGKEAKGTRENSKIRKAYETAKRKYKALGKRISKNKEEKLKAKKIPVHKANKRNARRSKAAREADKRTKAKEVVTDARWTKNPEKYDYPGVDTPRK